MPQFDVSVVIPTYNRAEYLPSCIGSILTALPSGCEVVVVDDGSSEDLRPAIRGFDDRVSLVRQANAGPAKARNTGAEASRGRYLCFLDSDDTWEAAGPGRVLAQLERVGDLGAVFADTAMGNPEDGYVSFVTTYGGDAFHALPGTEEPNGLRVLDRDPFLRRLSRRNVMFLGSLLVRREAFHRLKGFDVTLRGAADWEFFMRLVLTERTAFSPGAPMSRYLKHGDGMSTDDDHMSRDFIKALEAIRAFPALPAELRPHLDTELQRHRFGFAYTAYDRGDLPEARRRFLATARQSGPAVRSLAYAAMTCLPSGLVARMRRAKRGLHG